jgi:N-acetyl-gamma-glutamyl-phosphate reductase
MDTGLRVGIVGATGYTGVELLRLLGVHPRVEVCAITSRAEAGTRVDSLFPNRGSAISFCLPEHAVLEQCDVVFLPLRMGRAGWCPDYRGSKGNRPVCRFRLYTRLWEKWYALPHGKPEYAAEAVYDTQSIASR